MLQVSNSMVARTGREKQVYKKGGIRQVAGCVPINRKTGKILLITRRKKGEGWVLPKGGWENDESKQEAAARETYEEAGARGRITSLIGVWKHHVIKKKTGLPKAEFNFFEMEVDKLEENWPEMNERDRQWFSYEEALKELIKPFMREVVEHCSLAPSNNNNINQTGKSGLFVASHDEDRKDIWIWTFSILIIFLAFIVWYLSTSYYNDNNFNSEKFTSLFSFAVDH
ncbi:11258_t:CDS:2 [Funneliformis caledonium]|uniref:11258_t:CDS:1 n=1 Tax=Funneliformis caledonium TaxID=1117310 RepID=A0A9N8ZDY0_9GLOM|nr:11258_t:CDS:2 [Funneliformis caledonium]